MPRFPRNIVLIGARGSGKTVVGTALAARRESHFNDTDEMITDWESLPIPQIFAAYGETYFRDVEERVVTEVTARGGKVIATGGGVVLRDANVARLRGSGLVVFLDTTAEALRTRLAKGEELAARPSLTGAGSLAEIDAVLAERLPLYQGAADTIIDTTPLAPAQVVAAITAWLDATDLTTDYDPAVPRPAAEDISAS